MDTVNKNTRIRNVEVRVNSMLFMLFMSRVLLQFLLSKKWSRVLLQFFAGFVWFVFQPKKLHWTCKTHRQGCCPAVVMDWGTWVWRGQISARLNRPTTHSQGKVTKLARMFWNSCCNLRNNMEIYFDIFGGMKECSLKNDGRDWMDYTHTLHLLLMKHWSINSGYPLAKELIQWKSSFRQNYNVRFFSQSNLFNRQLPESVTCCLICECVSNEVYIPEN